MDASTTFNDMQAQTVTIEVKDKAGVVDTTTVATWESDNTSIVTVASDASGRNATLTGVAPGVAKVTATCGGITITVTVTVTNSGDASITPSFGAPYSK